MAYVKSSDILPHDEMLCLRFLLYPDSIYVKQGKCMSRRNQLRDYYTVFQML